MQAAVKSPNRVTSTVASHAVSLQLAGVLRNRRRSPSAWRIQSNNNLGEYMKRLASLVTVLICLLAALPAVYGQSVTDRKSTRLNSSHANISYAVFCLQ